MNVNIALLTVTDTRTLETDKSGNILQEKIKKANHNLIERKICKDNKKDIKKIIKNWLKKKKIDVIITDHHKIPTSYPKPFALLHPELTPSPNYLNWLSNFLRTGASNVRTL